MERMDDKAWYTAFQAKDARFDGRFFVGISSTGIYCRPVCRARLPKPENCTLYHTAAEAEQAGFRPCLLCRPELAPGVSITDASAALARRAARLLEETCAGGEGIEALAARLGCTDRHLRRVFQAEFSVPPVQYMQTCRLLLAKGLLTDTDLPVLDIAMAAGFGSLRRFNDLFKTRYHLSPTALRKQARRGAETQDGITLALGYRPPYRWEELLGFLAGRAISGVDMVRQGEYLRTVHLKTVDGGHVYGWIRVRNVPRGNALNIVMSETLLPVVSQVLARIRHLFDLYCQPDVVYETLSAMNAIRPGLCRPGTRLPGSFDAFEMALRAVLGQQITVKAAGTLAARLAQAYGTPVDTGIEGLTYTFPAPEDILALEGPIEDHLGPLGITGMRARTIRSLAQAWVNQEIDLESYADPQREMQALLAIPGIGPWTAQYIAMRAMGWPDAFLETDFGVKKALAPRTPAQIRALAEAWRPWRSYATVSLWHGLE